MAVAQRTTHVLEPLPRPRTTAATPVRPLPGRRHVHVREPHLGLLLRRIAIAMVPAACIVTAIYGRMQLLEATVQRSHLNASIRQERGKMQMLSSELVNTTRPEEIDRFAKDNGMVMQVTSPMFVAGHRKGR